MNKHKYYQQAYDAHRGTSFSPDKRAEQYCSDYDRDLAQMREKVAELGGKPDDFEEGYTRRWLAWMAAKGRCLSPMITGPSKFPTKRNEKANNAEHKRCEEFTTYCENYIARLAKAKRKSEAGDPITELETKLNEAKKWQETMKAINGICRKKATEQEKVALIMAVGVGEGIAKEALRPSQLHGTGFARYELTNNLARIKGMEQRLAVLQSRAKAETKEQERPDGIRIVENTDADRLQVFFPGKPTPEMITRLKKSAFKWSPSNGCWQRQLTANALHALKSILP
jgi:hypothetical protein